MVDHDIIDAVVHVRNEVQGYDDDGEPILEPVNRTEYEFTNEATQWEKEAVREYGVKSKDEVEDALEWREAVDAIDDTQLSRVMRGKHPKENRDIPTPNRG